MTIKAIYENGVFKPQGPVHLEEHTEVEVLIPERPSPDADDPTGWKAAETLIGFIDDAPPDMAENHDYYLYGQPKLGHVRAAGDPGAPRQPNPRGYPEP